MRKLWVLGILVVLLAGFSFGQETEPAQEREQQGGQPLIITVCGVSWQPIAGRTLKIFDDLGMAVVDWYFKDVLNVVGVARFIIVTNKDGTKFQVVGGWFKPHTFSKKQGFFLDEDGNFFVTPKTYAEGESVICKIDKDQPILRFIFLKIEYDEATQQDIFKEELVREIDIRQFVEKH